MKLSSCRPDSRFQSPSVNHCNKVKVEDEGKAKIHRLTSLLSAHLKIQLFAFLLAFLLLLHEITIMLKNRHLLKYQ